MTSQPLWHPLERPKSRAAQPHRQAAQRIITVCARITVRLNTHVTMAAYDGAWRTSAIKTSMAPPGSSFPTPKPRF